MEYVALVLALSVVIGVLGPLLAKHLEAKEKDNKEPSINIGSGQKSSTDQEQK